nr:hypothetical protein [Tanacetum cinerariifolium]
MLVIGHHDYLLAKDVRVRSYLSAAAYGSYECMIALLLLLVTSMIQRKRCNCDTVTCLQVLFKEAIVDAYEAYKTILDSYGETVILKRRRNDDDDQDEGPSAGSDRGSKRRREGKEPESASAPFETATRSACSEMAKQADYHSSFNELLDTPLDFSNFIMNRLRVDTLTPELLAGPTFELIKGSYTSLIELEYHVEAVYKATTNQLDWVNPKGQQYPHNLLQPLSLIPDNRGRRIIPFAHFINNDLEYLGGDWIMVRRDDDKLYKFKEGDFKRLRLQDIEDMLLLLVQGKLSNLTVEERFPFNVSLRMFTRSIMEECHWLLTDPVDLVNPEGHRLVPDVSKPLPLGGPPGQVTIQPKIFFNKYLEYLISRDTKVQSIPSWFGKIKLCLITLNAELQVSHTLFDNNAPDLQVDCIVNMNFV